MTSSCQHGSTSQSFPTSPGGSLGLDGRVLVLLLDPLFALNSIIPHSWLLPVLLFPGFPQWSLFPCDPPGAVCYFWTLIIHDTLIQSHSVLLPGPTYPVVVGGPVDISSLMYLKIPCFFPKGILIIPSLPPPHLCLRLCVLSG